MYPCSVMPPEFFNLDSHCSGVIHRGTVKQCRCSTDGIQAMVLLQSQFPAFSCHIRGQNKPDARHPVEYACYGIHGAERAVLFHSLDRKVHSAGMDITMTALA